jgi:hypothetical protein
MYSISIRAMAFAGLVVMLFAGSTPAQSQPQRGGSAEPPEQDVLLTPGGISDIYRPGVLAAVSKPASPRDFNGVWVMYRPGQKFPDANRLPLQPWAAEKIKTFDAVHDDPAASCLTGWPRELTVPYPVEVIQTSKFTLFWFEGFNVVRRVWTDGRGHDPDADLTFYGDSIGHWEKNTFVVETAGLIHQTLEGGAPLSDGAKTTERWQMLERGKALTVDVTVDDPKSYTAPFTFRLVFDRTADQLREYFCQQNNRNDPLKGQIPGNLLAPRTGSAPQRTPAAEPGRKVQ